MNDDALIEYRNVTRRFHSRSGSVVACEGVNLSVRRGEFMAVVGPSGCGKSTLLNMAAGLMAPSAGEVLYAGNKVPAPNTAVGYLTQRDTLLPWRTVEDNVAIALELRGQSRALRLRTAHEWLDRMGLAGFEKSYPAQLSGGMRRRVALARTLAYEPETILMDEPFGALDAQLRMVMHEELLKLWTGTRTTVIFVTHDLAEALTLADRIAVFSARPGRIRSIEVVDLPRPRDVFRIRFDRHFGELHDRLWSYIEASVRDDVMVN
jgi:NitT/TauT family transport system ATP-binding protein